MPFEQSVGPNRGADRQRIGINAHLLSGEAGYRRAGIHQYMMQTLRHLPWEADGPEYVLYARHLDGIMRQEPGLSFVLSRWPTERRLLRIAWEQVAWPVIAKRDKIDLIHSAAFVSPVWTPCATLVTVYDLSFIHFPQQFPMLQRWYLSSQTRRSCRQAQRVITISESSRQDVHQVFGVPLANIDVVRPGVDNDYRPLPLAEVAAFRQRQNLPPKFVLHVGTLQPRKNLPVLLEAFAKLGRPDLQLILIGGKGWMFDEIFARVVQLGLQDRVRFAGYVPDQELPLWYNAATLFVFPSLYEGFGMPVVEAMACGTPVIAADTSSIPEASGEAAVLFEPRNVVELAERMAAVLDDPQLSITMREKGLKQAQRFSWFRAGRETAEVYRSALLRQ